LDVEYTRPRVVRTLLHNVTVGEVAQYRKLRTFLISNF
jgi:hypothetical protein